MKRLKVLQVIPSFGVGGAEKVVLDYLYFQNKDKIEIKAVSLYSSQETIYNKFAKDNNLEIIYLNKKKGIDIKLIFQLLKIIKNYRPDVIHTHQYSLKYALLPAIIFKIKRKFHTIHSKPEWDSKGLNMLINKIGFKFFSIKPIALHSNMKKEVKEYYGIKECLVLPNGVNEKLYSESRSTEFKKSLNIPDNEYLIGHIGSFNTVKNHDFIIDVFSNLLKRKDATLILVGEGVLNEQIRKKVRYLGIENKVKFLGIRSDIPYILSNIDVFLFPSLFEGFPISLIEAQMAGVKCVISETIDDSAVINSNVYKLDFRLNISDWVDMVVEREDISPEENSIRNVYSINTIISNLNKFYFDDQLGS